MFLVHNSNGWLSGKWVISGSYWYGSNASTLIFHHQDARSWQLDVHRPKDSIQVIDPCDISWEIMVSGHWPERPLQDLCAGAQLRSLSLFKSVVGSTWHDWITLFGGKPLGKWHDDMILWYLVIFTLLGYPSELTRTCWLVFCIRSVVLSGQIIYIYIHMSDIDDIGLFCLTVTRRKIPPDIG